MSVYLNLLYPCSLINQDPPRDDCNDEIIAIFVLITKSDKNFICVPNHGKNIIDSLPLYSITLKYFTQFN